MDEHMASVMDFLSRDFTYFDFHSDMIEHLPHMMWSNYFDGWPKHKIDFYVAILGEASTIRCGRCGTHGTKHLVGHDETECLLSMRTERREWLLRTIKTEILQAIENTTIKRGSFLFPSSGWESMGSCESGNTDCDWPKEFDPLALSPRYHLMMKSEKEKKALIIEVAFMWEHWFRIEEKHKVYATKHEMYAPTIMKLKDKGYEVKFECFVISCRGVFCTDLHNFFHENFNFESDEIFGKMKAITTRCFEFLYDIHIKSSDKVSGTAM